MQIVTRFPLGRTATVAAAIALGLSLASTAAAEDAESTAPAAPAGEATEAGEAPDDMSLSGDQDGTVFGSLTVRGEDRIHIEFERPELRIDLDAREAPGLEWGDPLGVLQRSGIDLEAPFLAHSATPPARGLADAWAREFRRDDEVVRFRPDLRDVHRWRLEIVDSRSDTVAVFEGKGNPPDEIAWDGARDDGGWAEPGPSYSYALVASDKAGNQRTFPGAGFELPPYRIDRDDRTAFLFAGSELPPGWTNRPVGPAPSLLLEVATRLSREDRAREGVEIRAVARTFAQARQLGDAVAGGLGASLLGDPSRVRVVTDVRTDAPAAGTVVITSPAGNGEA